MKIHYFAELRFVPFCSELRNWLFRDTRHHTERFRGITKAIPSLFRGIFSERIFDCNPSLAVNAKAAAVLGSTQHPPTQWTLIIWGSADEAVLNNVPTQKNKNKFDIRLGGNTLSLFFSQPAAVYVPHRQCCGSVMIFTDPHLTFNHGLIK